MIAMGKLLVVIILLLSTSFFADDLFDSNWGNNENGGSLQDNAAVQTGDILTLQKQN